jgi:CYTH domain-containing protein
MDTNSYEIEAKYAITQEDYISLYQRIKEMGGTTAGGEDDYFSNPAIFGSLVRLRKKADKAFMTIKVRYGRYARRENEIRIVLDPQAITTVYQLDNFVKELGLIHFMHIEKRGLNYELKYNGIPIHFSMYEAKANGISRYFVEVEVDKNYVTDIKEAEQFLQRYLDDKFYKDFPIGDIKLEETQLLLPQTFMQ